MPRQNLNLIKNIILPLNTILEDSIISSMLYHPYHPLLIDLLIVIKLTWSSCVTLMCFTHIYKFIVF